MRSIALVVALLMTWAGDTVGQHSVNILINSGFVMRAADTPAKLARLRSFPKDKFVARKTAAGQLYYIYADPDLCVCAYVGTPQAMAAYRDKWNAATVIDPEPSGRLRGQQFADSEMIHDMMGDDMESQFDSEAFAPTRF